MLREIVVEGLGVIEHAEADLDAGLNVVTGETGAGKTLMVAALGLLLGGRADRSLVAGGRSEAIVQGRFTVSPGHPATEVLIEQGLLDATDAPEIEIIIVRTIPADGRSGRVRVNGRLTGVGALATLAASLVEIAGQHEHLRMATPGAQRELLDASAGPETVAIAAEVRTAVRAARAARTRMEALLGSAQERAREMDVLTYEVEQIDSADVRAGEIAALRETSKILGSAETVAGHLQEALEALRGETGAEVALGRARRAIETAARDDPRLAGVAQRLASVAIELDDVAAELSSLNVVPDPQRLEAVEARLGELARLTRRYGEDETEVLAYLERSRARLAALQALESDASGMEAEVAALTERAMGLAGELSELRRSAAGSLEERMKELLAELGLAGARFEVSLEPAELTEGGLESVTFLVATNPGGAPRPLGKVASGGELSRIALGLRVLSSRTSVTTMVFDEVDAGVGGAAAHAVGRTLARLAEHTQVIVVTHLPQVAAFATGHLRIAKESDRSSVRARVVRVEGEERVEELSRMLAGLPESERAREHARELLEIAGRS